MPVAFERWQQNQIKLGRWPAKEIAMTTYGDWKVTKAEYDAARKLSIDNDEPARAAYQLIRYCHGLPHYREQAEAALQAIRSKT